MSSECLHEMSDVMSLNLKTKQENETKTDRDISTVTGTRNKIPFVIEMVLNEPDWTIWVIFQFVTTLFGNF